MMPGNVSLKYAVRNLLRHKRRTLLSILGVGLGGATALLALSWMNGAHDMQVRAIVESGAGHLRLVHEDWPETRENTLRMNNWREGLDAVRTLPQLETYTLRARADGLLALGNRSAAVQITALTPDREFAVNRLLQRGTLEGRYLRPEDANAVVIGKTLARRLNAEPGDDLLATVSGLNDIHAAMFRVVGILDTGSQELDASVCHITLETLENLTGLAGPAEISLVLTNEEHIGRAQARLDAAIPHGNALITWREISPGLAANIDGAEAIMRMLASIVVFMVALGIASAQLTAVLERRAELAMLSALGMRGKQLALMMMTEAVLVGLNGAVLACIVGGGGAWYLARYGVNLAALVERGAPGVGDVLFDSWLHGDFGLWIVGYALVISLTTTLLAAVYPAWKATRIMPAELLRNG